MLERVVTLGARITAIVVMLAGQTPALAQPRPWRPIPRFESRCTAEAATAELERATANRMPTEPGGAWVMLQDGEPLATRYFGVERIGGPAIGPETRFYIGSLAKTITATAALMLRERGALRLEDPLGRWIDGLPAFARDVRIIHLLQHTSGLPDIFEALGDTVSGLDNARVLGFVRGLDSLRFAPGERHAYSNTGYVLLAEVIGKASGRGFAPFVEDSILKPLGMTATTLVRKGAPAIPHRAVGYRRAAGGFVPDDLRDHWSLGSGGIHSTLGDMITWYRAVVSSRLLRPSSTALLFDPPVTTSGRKSHLGMGWSDETMGSRTPDVDGLRAFGSFGSLAGFRSALMFYPDHGLAWIALTNAGEGELPPEGMPMRLFRKLP
jgi:CubicO group peptidase (beta-lactamase class C family)